MREKMFRENSKKLNALTRFSRDEDGTIIPFVVVLFLTMFVGAGLGVDFMRHEAARADLQNALDRGVLAAAALSQDAVVDDDGDNDLDDEYQDLVAEYMESRSFPLEPTLSVDWTESINSKTIEASATYDMKTYILRLIGIPTIAVPAQATARQAINDIEISLVLDVSGSMFNPSYARSIEVEPGVYEDQVRATIMKTEAKNFVKLILDADDTGLRRTINLVPYSHQVSMTAEMAGLMTEYTNNQDHNYSHCIDFATADYSTATLPKTTAYQQTQAFKWRDNRSNVAVYGCSRASNAVKIAQNDTDDLDDLIDGLTEEHNTAVFLGMKWGTAMLDPSTDYLFKGLAASGTIPNDFKDLPRAYGTSDSIKAVVLMSDGENTYIPRIRDDVYEGSDSDPRGPDYWAERRPSSRGNGSQCTQAIASSNNKNTWAYRSNECDNTEGTYLTYDGVTTKSQFADNSSIQQGDARLYEICDAAKNAGIVVYTIGFEAGTNANRALEQCASGSRFYQANGINLGDVFDAIAADIEKLKLTQ